MLSGAYPHAAALGEDTLAVSGEWLSEFGPQRLLVGLEMLVEAGSAGRDGGPDDGGGG